MIASRLALVSTVALGFASSFWVACSSPDQPAPVNTTGGTPTAATSAGGGTSTSTGGGVVTTTQATGGSTSGTTGTGTTTGGVTTASTTGAGGGTTTTSGTPTTTSTTGVGGATSTTSAVTSTTGGTPVTCNFTITPSLSDNIPTVGIVDWSSDLANINSAYIEFGPAATGYTMSAPVDLAEMNYRTLLLGMKASSDYNFRIVAGNGTEECTSEAQMIHTGDIPNGTLPDLTVDTPNPGALTPGFTMTGQYSQGGGGSPAYVFDTDGDFVWWYELNTDVTCARMSYDGKWMYMMAANVPDGQANVHRVRMDGSGDENLSQAFAGANHSLTVLPDDRVAFYAYGNNGCDDIKIYDPGTGQATTVINAQDAHGASGACHCNGIEYSHDDDTLVFSDLDHNNITKVTLTGEVVWVLGGTTSDFTGDGSSWDRQHGLQPLSADRILFFNNGGLGGGGGGSVALEVLLDTGAMTATVDWQYAASPGIANQIMGDVQRLPNGNTLVSYSTQGQMHEVDASGGLVQSIGWGINGAFGYVTKRPTLYGPPPK